ncbi:MAG: response regulator transcription factor [Betaproteobacteria bacterium]|nr:response regulator transcription factor [Betaproteobacteria bacterium]
MIRIILVDDHALVREGVSRLLEAQRDMRVIGSFGEGRTAIRFAASNEPDVAVVDITMPQESGIDTARQLREASPDTHLLILSMHANPEYVHQALLAGALGYVVKDSAGRVLVEAVRAVHAGQRFLSDSLDHKALQRYVRNSEKEDPLTRLSKRERQVLRHTVEGRTIIETAKRLGLSTKSVETYRSRTMTKLAIKDLTALVKFAIRHGVTSLE